MDDNTRKLIKALDDAVIMLCKRNTRPTIERYEKAIANLAGVTPQDVADAINGQPQ